MLVPEGRVEQGDSMLASHHRPRPADGPLRVIPPHDLDAAREILGRYYPLAEYPETALLALEELLSGADRERADRLRG